MTDATSPPTTESADEAEPSPFRVALGFFILPLFLVIGAIGVFLLFGVLAHDDVDPATYLPEINGRGINEPWQAAFHLSQQLQFNEELKGDAAFAGQVIRALENAEGRDPRIRRFLTIALGRLEHESAIPVLTAHLNDEDGEVRVNSLWALGTLQATQAAASVAPLLQDTDEGVRTMAAYVLGVLADPDTGTALQVSLNDPVPAVRFNSAVSLGLMGNDAGVETLQRMLDRGYLADVPGVTEADLSTTMLAALAAIRALRPGGMEETLSTLRDSDPDLRVRESAREALTAIQTYSDAGALRVSER